MVYSTVPAGTCPAASAGEGRRGGMRRVRGGEGRFPPDLCDGTPRICRQTYSASADPAAKPASGRLRGISAGRSGGHSGGFDPEAGGKDGNSGIICAGFLLRHLCCGRPIREARPSTVALRMQRPGSIRKKTGFRAASRKVPGCGSGIPGKMRDGSSSPPGSGGSAPRPHGPAAEASYLNMV